MYLNLHFTCLGKICINSLAIDYIYHIIINYIIKFIVCPDALHLPQLLKYRNYYMLKIEITKQSLNSVPIM